jgi:hypothetical protein
MTTESTYQYIDRPCDGFHGGPTASADLVGYMVREAGKRCVCGLHDSWQESVIR